MSRYVAADLIMAMKQKSDLSQENSRTWLSLRCNDPFCLFLIYSKVIVANSLPVNEAVSAH